MKKTNSKLVISAGMAAVLAGHVPAALSHEDGSAVANAGYLSDSRGHVVFDGYGNCVRTSSWTPELVIPACDPDMVVKKPEPVAAAPAPRPQPKFESISMDAGALFDTESSTLKVEGRRELDALVERMNRTAEVNRIDVIGHTDSRGTAEYNQALSERRAAAVKAYLVEKGVAADLITASGRGEMNPVADNNTASGRAMNRRVEIGITAIQRVQ